MNTTTKVKICQVCAVTQYRRDRYGKANQGVMLVDIDTREKFWTNDYKATGLQFADYVRYYNNQMVKVDFSDIDF